MEKEKIKKRIELMGLKKGHIAKVIGTSQQMLSHYLNDRRNLDEATVIKLKQYLNL